MALYLVKRNGPRLTVSGPYDGYGDPRLATATRKAKGSYIKVDAPDRKTALARARNSI